MKKLSHVNEDGKVNMVDVSNKKEQIREAWAEGFISLRPSTIKLIKENKMKKGEVLTIAEIAGIQAGKKTSELIPLCHPLQITKIDVKTSLKKNGVVVSSYAKCIDQTGIEMETLTATSVALLTIYDMCKAVDKEMKIGEIKLIEKKKTDL
ncbi:MAG: cyclic pyranopterin monophosphate synthase MoaC [Ignavibacteriales bacterium]|jgi:cyclic pyranopterin phosphate synthase|nr:cyclic pyranopterin monophosphate synthase MoaC [Ignavibacteriales bacterium]